ncbi:hypothetical protein B5X24_HaOG208465 [Helicoverpa armigera]|uniref:Uncharacterized protein n=1 Tax=Helicoverpa armigera TaxID=29058 RepID=A0A2W1BM76_HELAM|nr:hypothetical protein B5X24_HaOG208465 [Helicoverpa armigera]
MSVTSFLQSVGYRLYILIKVKFDQTLSDSEQDIWHILSRGNFSDTNYKFHRVGTRAAYDDNALTSASVR